MSLERLFRHDHDHESALDPTAADRPGDPLQDHGRAGRIESNAQLAGVVQREADPAINTGAEGGELEGGLADQIQSERSNGKPVDEGVRLEVEEQLGHDFSEVRVHTDPQAQALAGAVGARAFTTGRDIFVADPALATDPTLMAHELVHTVQQGMNEDKPSAVGAVGTAEESQADVGAADPGAIQATVQRYTDDKKVEGQYARVSDGGKVVVLGQSNYSQDLYATTELIDGANAKLAKSGDKGSYLSLIKTGDSLKHAGNTLHKAAPVFKPQGDGKNKGLADQNKGKDEDDKMSLYADCGRSSRVVMGSHGDAQPHATYKDGGAEKETDPSYRPSTYSDKIYMDVMPDFLKNPAHTDFLKSGVHYGADKSDLIMPSGPTEARKQYWELGDKGRRVFDQFAGINSAANPQVGGGYTLNTEYDMPGFKEMGKMTWNFHWAGVVMKDGSDNITLENYADGNGYDSINTEWNFQMYGTIKKGQTFHEQHLDSNTHGNRGSAFAVEPEGS
jgi:hypothetical protein